MKYIDFLYLIVYSFYKRKFKSDITCIYAISVIVLLFFLHLILFNKIIEPKGFLKGIFPLNKQSIIIVFLILYSLFSIRYILILPFEKLNERKKIKNEKLVRKIYFIYLILFFVALIIFI